MHTAHAARSSSAHCVPAPPHDPMFHNVPLCSSAPSTIPPLNGDENQNVLTLYPHLATLAPIQAQALALLLHGLSVATTARRIGVERHTVSRWRNHHPAFVAELNRQQEELISQSTILYQRALRKSFKLIHSALSNTESPDALKTALSLARTAATRQTVTRDPGPTNVLSVVNAMAAQEQRLVGDTYQDSYVHQDMAHRLARLDLAPAPAAVPPHDSTNHP